MNIKCPDVPVLKLLLEEMATRRQHSFMPHCGNSGNQRALETVLFLGGIVEWKEPERTPKGLYLISSSSLFF